MSIPCIPKRYFFKVTNISLKSPILLCKFLIKISWKIWVIITNKEHAQSELSSTHGDLYRFPCQGKMSLSSFQHCFSDYLRSFAIPLFHTFRKNQGNLLSNLMTESCNFIYVNSLSCPTKFYQSVKDKLMTIKIRPEFSFKIKKDMLL